MAASDFSQEAETKGFKWFLGIVGAITVIIVIALGGYWSIEPTSFDVIEEAKIRQQEDHIDDLPIGYVYANTLAHIAETLLYKPGGYITNDVGVPGVYLDNITSWEYGVLVMLRDATSALRNHLARSQSQSAEDPDLANAEPYFYYEHNSWALPSSESEYQKGIDSLHKYMVRLADPSHKNPGHFYSRADNLWQYIEIIIKRLGGLSTQLSASTDRYEAYDIKLEKSAAISQTSWLMLDNVFWQARGSCWALLHILKAIKHDFRLILEDKRAMDTVNIMIHEMENALAPITSPVILNGNGYGIFANYSLAMASYVSRANAAALDLRDVMNRG
ncbi:DUF2333 family protein [methanotrophic endosymbiont of Bathymodiolus puteoserpentis (Logatchev)]|jgi:hypothetical protein|uniref:DUF2333 family protein n=1 Tax=methanotrophic endosymbiont of Bathymodiolus puteoserpentis (Logatchev) TaxID=343235 RepID=UPI0013CA817F|nr:DUF2333 family protein [methanotrophic endosymbiont of Bathymodiolus puteoserpentis (Logatchev)]SHE19072.1 FIG00808377: hypothetical protein [methanotrophic endosymbiont of Bathymodiolus puteoserpentis (Logatchev)]